MRTIIIALAIGWAVLSGVGAHAEVEPQGYVKTAPVVQKEETVEPGPMSIEDRIQALTPRERIAQLMMVTLTGSFTSGSNDRTLLKDCKPGAVVVSGMLAPTHAAAYTKELRLLCGEQATGIPLLVGADMAILPRTVMGLQAEYFAPMPSLLSIAAAHDPESTARLIAVLGDHLVGMGFNMQVGPCLSLAPDVAGARGAIDCLGSDPRFVGETGGQIVKAMSDRGILAVPTGFPGGQWNAVEKTPATLGKSVEGLRESELIAFKLAIDAGARAIAVGNTRVPMLDPDGLPASLSPTVMRDILRDEMGFDGVIVAGPLDDIVFQGKNDAADAAIAALRAGADMIHWRRPGSHLARAVAKIEWAVQERYLTLEMIDEALARVLRLKEELSQVARKDPKASDAAKLEKNRQYPKDAFQVERRAVTLVRNRDNLLPLRKEESGIVGVTGVVGVDELYEALKEHLKTVVQQPIVSARHGKDIYDFELNRVVSRADGIGTVICTFTSEVRVQGQIRMIRELKAKGVKVVVVLVGYPDSLAEVAEADAIILTFCDPTAPSQAMKAVGDAIAGSAAIAVLPSAREIAVEAGQAHQFDVLDILRAPAGRLPVSICPPFLAGHAVSYDPSVCVKKLVWDFGDGERSKEPRTEHRYAEPGRYPVTLTITDVAGEETTHLLHAVVR